MNREEIENQYHQLTRLLLDRNLKITTMESITSGQLASLIADLPGASAVFNGSFVTYSNDTKIHQGVRKECIEEYGVYSYETAVEMAEACRKTYQADIGIGVTGSMANVDPNNSDSVAGEVYFAISMEDKTDSFFLKLPVNLSRMDCKYYIAENIGKEIIRRITNE